MNLKRSAEKDCPNVCQAAGEMDIARRRPGTVDFVANFLCERVTPQASETIVPHAITWSSGARWDSIKADYWQDLNYKSGNGPNGA